MAFAGPREQVCCPQYALLGSKLGDGLCDCGLADASGSVQPEKILHAVTVEMPFLNFGGQGDASARVT